MTPLLLISTLLTIQIVLGVNVADVANVANKWQAYNGGLLATIMQQHNKGWQCPGRAECLPLAHWRKGRCRWRQRNFFAGQTKDEKQAVVNLVNLLQQNQNYVCRLGRKPGLCCPGEDECYFDNNVPPQNHDQCRLNNQHRRCVRNGNGNGGICDGNNVCITSRKCSQDKPICNEDRTCSPCKQTAECLVKSQTQNSYNKPNCKLPQGICVRCVDQSDCPTGEQCIQDNCDGRQVSCKGFPYQGGDTAELETSINSDSKRLVCHFHFGSDIYIPNTWKCWEIAKGTGTANLLWKETRNIVNYETHKLKPLVETCREAVKAVNKDNWSITQFFETNSDIVFGRVSSADITSAFTFNAKFKNP